MEVLGQESAKANDKLRKLLDHYLGRPVADRILHEKGDGRPQLVYATVMFADIRSFTTISEGLDLEELFEQISEYFTMMNRAVEKHSGVLLSFGGDSVLALFGALDNETNHALHAVRASAEIMDQLAILNQERMAKERPPFRVGIGANSGEMVIGHLGYENRKEFTVLGDCVNTAKRLSDLSKEMPFYSIFVTNSCLEGARDCGLSSQWDAFDMGKVEVKGKRRAVPTFAISPPE